MKETSSAYNSFVEVMAKAGAAWGPYLFALINLLIGAEKAKELVHRFGAWTRLG